ncbi:FeoA family protein [Gudongella sp. DL1XJH-153]|uniref:FeoA family protein n=1 Tax=Gudongella sp. DL1XJH-153 TaxID=3409804 RepID=UPI003BB7B6BF
MEVSLVNRIFGVSIKKKTAEVSRSLDLTSAKIDHTYTIKAINTDDKEMKSFLSSLGCYEGENITVISVLAENYIINIKDSRYSIDIDLARAILI